MKSWIGRGEAPLSTTQSSPIGTSGHFNLAYRPHPIPLPAEVVVAIRSDLLFRHDQAEGGLEGSTDSPARRRRRYSAISALDLRQVVLVNLAPLGAEAEAVVLDLEEGDGVRLLGQRLVEDQDRGLDAGIGIEHPRRKRDDGDEVLLHQHLAQLLVGGLALEDDALGTMMPARPLGVRCSAM